MPCALMESLHLYLPPISQSTLSDQRVTSECGAEICWSNFVALFWSPLAACLSFASTDVKVAQLKMTTLRWGRLSRFSPTRFPWTNCALTVSRQFDWVMFKHSIHHETAAATWSLCYWSCARTKSDCLVREPTLSDLKSLITPLYVNIATHAGATQALS